MNAEKAVCRCPSLTRQRWPSPRTTVPPGIGWAPSEADDEHSAVSRNHDKIVQIIVVDWTASHIQDLYCQCSTAHHGPQDCFVSNSPHCWSLGWLSRLRQTLEVLHSRIDAEHEHHTRDAGHQAYGPSLARFSFSRYAPVLCSRRICVRGTLPSHNIGIMALRVRRRCAGLRSMLCGYTTCR